METRVPFISNLEGAVSEDGRNVLLEVSTKAGTKLGFALGAADIEKMVSFIIKLAQESAALHAHPVPRSEAATVNPVDVAALGIARGRTDAEAILAIQVGPLTLSFAVSVGMLLEQLERLRFMTVRSGRESKPS